MSRSMIVAEPERRAVGKRGVKVFSVFPGSVDTDMIRSFELPKTPAIDVARAVLTGIEAGDEHISPTRWRVRRTPDGSRITRPLSVSSAPSDVSGDHSCQLF
ncbi:MAG: hypothetical protein ABJB66_09080 [Gemmatimonadaceae bacterium]